MTEPAACPNCRAPWSRQRMTVDDSPVKYMAEKDGKIYLQVPWTLPHFVCENCNHKWDKPANVIVGD